MWVINSYQMDILIVIQPTAFLPINVTKTCATVDTYLEACIKHRDSCDALYRKNCVVSIYCELIPIALCACM